MRLLKLSKFRRCRPPPPPLLHFVSHYSSSSSHSLLTSSVSHHRNRWRNYNPGCVSELLRHSPPDRFSFSRRFSAEPGVSGPVKAPPPLEADESDEPLLAEPGVSESDQALLPFEAADPDEPFIAVQAVISLLDYYHGATGFPWWIVLSTSAIAMKLALFPISVVQLKKMRRLGALLPRLPRPFPPPQSKRSFRDQFALFLKEKKLAKCPSLFWFVSSFAIQVPCFFLWIASIRRMCLDHHPGFDSGGILWFQNLIEYPHGPLGFVFPFCIVALHLTNIQFSFAKLEPQKLPDALGSLTKGYRGFLLIMALPMMTASCSVPQGSLVYWLSNSTLTLIQHSCLRNPTVVKYLGLPKVITPVEAPAVKKIGNSGLADIVIMTMEGEVHAHTLSPVELVNYSIKVLSNGRKDIAIMCLRLALDKDPGFVRAMLILGQTLKQEKQVVEAAEYFEMAISKLLADGYPTKVEELDLLILSSQWAGIANVEQGKMEQGLVHLERIAELKEPKDAKSKAYYYDGLLLLSSALVNVGREDEARKYLSMAAAYDPAYSVYIQHLEDDSKKLSDDPFKTKN